MGRAPWACVHQGDFFAWAARTRERFECAAGNGLHGGPPLSLTLQEVLYDER